MAQRISAALAATAHHEAGHVVAAILKGLVVEHVTIDADAGVAGYVQYLQPAEEDEQTHERGVVALAGEAAQRRFNPRSIRRHHGGGDREQVLSYAVNYAGSVKQAEALVRYWEVRASELVERYWAQIQRVAAELLKHRTLTRQDVQRMVVPQR